MIPVELGSIIRFVAGERGVGAGHILAVQQEADVVLDRGAADEARLEEQVCRHPAAGQMAGVAAVEPLVQTTHGVGPAQESVAELVAPVQVVEVGSVRRIDMQPAVRFLPERTLGKQFVGMRLVDQADLPGSVGKIGILIAVVAADLGLHDVADQRGARQHVQADLRIEAGMKLLAACLLPTSLLRIENEVLPGPAQCFRRFQNHQILPCRSPLATQPFRSAHDLLPNADPSMLEKRGG